MTASLYLANIADSVSQIDLSAISADIKDKDQLAASFLAQPGVIIPITDGEGWISGFSIRLDSVFEGADAPMTVMYTLNYRYLWIQVPDPAVWPAAYSALADKVIAIVNALIAVPSPYSGRVDMKVSGVSLGPRSDPSGNQFLGADIALSIEEMQN